MSLFDVPLDPPRAARPSAWRRPLLVLAYAGYLLVAGFLVAAPWATLVHDTAAGYPRGDAELFDPGGILLVEALRFVPRAAPAAMTSTGLVALLASALGLFPFAMLIAGIGREGRVRAPFLAARAADSIGTLTLLWGLGAAAQAGLGVLVALLGGKVIDWLHLGSRGEGVAQVILGVVVLVAVLPLGVARDLAAVSAVDDRTRFYTAASRGLRVLLRAPGRAIGAYVGRTLVALAVLVVALALPAILSVSAGAGGVAMAFAAHQLAIVIAVFLRASWLAAAIRLLEDRAPLPRPEPALAAVEAVPTTSPPIDADRPVL